MTDYFRILVLTKRQYTNKDLIDDLFGRIREIPLELTRNGHSVHGLCLSYRKRRCGVFQDERVLWESVNAGPLFKGGLLQFVLRARQLAPEADIIWACSDSFFGVIGYVLSRRLNKPLVFDLYDNFESFLIARIPVFRALYRHAVRNCEAVTVASRSLMDLVRSYGRTDGVYLIENAFDPRLFHKKNSSRCRFELGLPAEASIVGTAGALTRNRGIETLFQAFNLMSSRNDMIHLAVAGPRDIPIPKHDRIHDLGVLPYDRIPDLLNALDVGVICNLDSNFGSYCFPQKAREMMACDLPIVSANVGSMKALLGDHPEWLYRQEDARHLASVVENRIKDARTDYGLLPTWSDQADKLAAIFRTLRDARQPRSDPPRAGCA